ncbi:MULTISPECIES: hypothetical protein [unclassified Flavobacterium]|uniref:hypothetical protein n=1 Tax=unclassified Flavobacterium TaxID=196869 RepID=UPI00104FED73|nr:MULTISPECIES: hypothetical protein [unclassified Flavobacterium]
MEKQPDKTRALRPTQNINKPLKLNTVNKGEPTDNVLVHGANNEIKSIPWSEFGKDEQIQDATYYQKGIIRLSGDLAGTADYPIVPALAEKQDRLVSGINISTINGQTLLGSGDVTISGGTTVSGTSNYLPKFNAEGNNIINSNVISDNNELLIQGAPGKSGLRFSNMLSSDKFAETRIDLSKYFSTISAKCGIDKKGNAYFQDNSTMQIVKITPDKIVTAIPFQAKSYINTWCADNLGNIYFTALDFNLYKIDSNGVLTSPAYDKTLLPQVSKLGIDSANNIYVSQALGNSIYKLNTALEASLFFTFPKTFNYYLNNNILFDSFDNLYTDVGYSDASFYKISPEGQVLYSAFGSGATYGIPFFFVDKDTVYTVNQVQAGFLDNDSFTVSKVSNTGQITRLGVIAGNGKRMNSVELFEGNIYYARFDGSDFIKFDTTLGTSSVILNFPQAGIVFSLNPKGVFNILYGSGSATILEKQNRGNRTTNTGEIVLDDFYKSDRLILDTPLQVNSNINLNLLKNSSNYLYTKTAEWNIGTIKNIVEDSQGNIYALVDNDIYKINYKGESSLLATAGIAPLVLVVSNDILYTANSGDGSVSKITLNGTVTTLSTGVPNCRNIVFDSLGNLILLANSYPQTAGTIYKITPAGVKSTIKAIGNHHPYLAIDSSDNIYTTQFGSNPIFKTTMAGVSSRIGTGTGRVYQGPIDSYVRFVSTFGATAYKTDPTGITTSEALNISYNISPTYSNGNIYSFAGNVFRQANVATGAYKGLLNASGNMLTQLVSTKGNIWIAVGTYLQKYEKPYSKLLTTTETGNIIQLEEEISQKWIKNNKIIENVPVFEDNTSAKTVLPINHLYRTSTGVIMITF